jgi:hypothetical protein
MTSRWVCPHCDHASIITSTSIKSDAVTSTLDSQDGALATSVQYIACPNPACKRTTLTIWYGSGALHANGYVNWIGAPKSRRLMPPGYARPIPAYVPEAIRQDYEEACAIADFSPKAAAALARRALQGIIRDFHGIVRTTLNKELEALKPTIDPLIWSAIDAVRSVGNIGAHMENDISVIVDVDPEEAVKLIRLIELLLTESYVARHNREEALAGIVALGADKQKQRRGEGGSTDNTRADEAPSET